MKTFLLTDSCGLKEEEEEEEESEGRIGDGESTDKWMNTSRQRKRNGTERVLF